MAIRAARPKTAFIGTSGAAIGIGVVLSLIGTSQANAATTAVDLRTATSYAVLAGTAVTNTGPSVVSGDIGVSPGSSAGGFPPGSVVNGNIHAADAVTLGAQNDLTTAFTDAAGRTPPDASGLANLAGMTLISGTYSGGALSIAGVAPGGVLQLDVANDPSSVWIFQASSSLVTDSGTSVVFINGIGNPCNVFWEVGSSATLGSGSVFVGTVMALTSITAVTGATVQGRLLARNGAVTLDTNTITVPAGCAGTIAPGGTTTSPIVNAPPTGTTNAPPTGTTNGPAAATGAGPSLAATGKDNTVPTVAAVALVAGGLFLSLIARRRRPTTTTESRISASAPE